ncbi:MAG TPA: DUF3293 domain-containing protein [Candidatus Binatia bacterium]|nr:DUF3293 domain-containing protein [Candidatus Binatia bacterium]
MTEPARRGDPSWARYPDTVLEIYRDGVMRFDLRKPLEASDRGTLRELGLGHTFAVVTAANPRGRQVGEAENHLRAEQLDDAVVARGMRFLRADGTSPEGLHREVGVAIAASQADACELARRFEQSALFWFDGDRFWIVPVLEAGKQPLALPVTATEKGT